MAEREVGEAAPRAAVWPAAALALFLALPAGCSREHGAAPPVPAADGRVAREAKLEAVPGAPAPRQALAAAAAPSSTAVPSGLEAMAASRRLIRTGRLSLEVASYAEASRSAVRMAEALRGYLADSQSTRSEQGKLRGSLTLRVPAEQFGALLDGLRTLGTVQGESVSAQDVTKAYADLETRLRVKRQTAERLQQILATRTAKLSDVLEAERELARVTEEIETLEGERRFYDQQVALSTITAELAEPLPLVRSGFLDPIRRALAESLELLGASIAALLSVAVVATPWLLVLAGLWWLARRRRARRAA